MSTWLQGRRHRLPVAVLAALLVMLAAWLAVGGAAPWDDPAPPSRYPYPYVVRTLEGATITVMPEDLDRAERCLAQAMSPCPPPP